MLKEFTAGRLVIQVDENDNISRLKEALRPLKWRSRDSIDSDVLDRLLAGRHYVYLWCEDGYIVYYISQTEANGKHTVTVNKFLSGQTIDIQENDIKELLGGE